MPTTRSEMFPSRLRELRESKGLSQREVAEIMTKFGLKMTQTAINRHERGTRSPDALTLDLYSRILGVPMYEIFLSRDAIKAYNEGLSEPEAASPQAEPAPIPLS